MLVACSEEHATKLLQKKMEKLYRDKRWLEKEYLVKKKSSFQIGKECGVRYDTVCGYLKGFEIPIRSFSESGRLHSNHVALTKVSSEFLSGLLLGDGHLESYNDLSAGYAQASKFRRYLEWLSGKLRQFKIEQAGRVHEKRCGRVSKEGYYSSFYYHSRFYVELQALHRKWYRKARKDEKFRSGRQKRWIKILPSDLELTPVTCLMWYLGDGYSRDKRLGIGRALGLCTCGFARDEVRFLIPKLEDLGFLATYQKSNNTIRLPRRSAVAFLSYIGSCPISCYNYRWKIE